MKKYAVHGGIVWSADGDRHKLSPMQVAECYGLSHSSEFIVWDIHRPETIEGRKWEDYIHLFPRDDGNYDLPRIKEDKK